MEPNPEEEVIVMQHTGTSKEVDAMRDRIRKKFAALDGWEVVPE